MTNYPNVMEQYPDARKLRALSMSEGVSSADRILQEAMVNSARIKAEASILSVEGKNMYDVTSYGQAWISDNLIYLSEKLMDKPTTEICKAFINFPPKFKTEEGTSVSSDEYLKNVAYFRSKGLKYIAEKEGNTLSREQVKINEFVSAVMKAKSRAATASFIILTEIISVSLSGKDCTLTSTSSHIISNILNQLLVLKSKELKEIMDVPSVSQVRDTKKFCRVKDNKPTVKGAKLLKILGIQSLKSLETENFLAEGRMLLENVADALSDVTIFDGNITLEESCREKMNDIRTRSLNSSFEARPVLERPISDGIYNSYKEAPLKDFLVGGYRDYTDPVVISDLDRKAIDRIQGTAFGINRRVLKTLKEANELGVVVGDKLNVPSPDNYPALPDFPVRSESKDLKEYNEAKRVWFDVEGNKERYRKWKLDANERLVTQKASQSVNDMNSRTLEIAQWYADWGGPFYLPVFLDYRTRIYYMPTILNPQSSKLAKSLFVANRGKAIGTEEALDFWMVSFSGTMKSVICPKTGKEYSGDKTPWNLAISAGRSGLSQGAAVASNPLSEESIALWTNQEEPFSYLAHCFECSGILESGIDHVSSIFINMDGSCNAYQHASGYLGDKATGELVNLTARSLDSDPADMYGTVADWFLNNCDKNNNFHRLFKFHDVISRSSCKRITMCQGYGLTKVGALRYGVEEIEKYTDKDSLINPFDAVGREEASFQFSEGVWEGVESVAPAVVKVKEALQIMGTLACDSEWNPSGVLSWTTFTGTKVSYTKKIQVTNRIYRQAGNKRVNFCIKKYLDSVDSVAISNANPPNYTHSRDADHMRLSVSAMPEGCYFLVVHDSFGTLAADAPLFSRVIKEQFIKMYKDKEPLKDLFYELLDPMIVWLTSKGLDKELLLDQEYLDDLLAKSKTDFKGPKFSKLRYVIRNLEKIRLRIQKSNDLDFDNILNCVYSFR